MGRKPLPTAIRKANGNPGRRAWNHDEPIPPRTLPTCPRHLSVLARTEWRRIAACLHDMGVLTLVDRAALAAYCQAWGRWVEAEERLKETPILIRTPSGYVQQSPWLSVANRQLEIMGRYMAELGITPAARSRVKAFERVAGEPVTRIELVALQREDEEGRALLPGDATGSAGRVIWAASTTPDERAIIPCESSD